MERQVKQSEWVTNLKMVRQVKQSEWVAILKTMLFYNRSYGYVNDVEGVLTFFDGDTCIDGVYSFYVTLEDVNSYISNYEKASR
jgi:hypothetical protein